MQRIILCTLILCAVLTTGFAQVTVTWDGGGADNSWDTPENWDGDIVPGNLDTVLINGTAFIGGTASTSPIHLIVSAGANFRLLTDLTIGDASGDINTLQLNSNSMLRIDDGFALTINSSANKFGVQFPGNSTDAMMIVRSGSTLTINGGRNAINIGSSTASLRNLGGTIAINAPSSIGLRNVGGTVENQGTITVTGAGTGVFTSGAISNQGGSANLSVIDASTTGISIEEATGELTNSAMISVSGTTNDGFSIKNGGSIVNDVNGTITVGAMQDDGVDMREGTIQNDGTINITMRAGSTNNNAGIVIGTPTLAASLTNTSNNSLNFMGAADGPTLLIAEMGTVTNTGTITAMAGTSDRRMFVEGALNNELGAIIDLTDGRIVVDVTGSMINTGLLKNDWTNPAGNNAGLTTSSGGTSINNAFYSWENSNAFSIGAGADPANDSGINLQQNSSRIIDAMGLNVVDIAEAPYSWEYMGAPIGTADATGSLTVDCGALDDTNVWIRATEFDEPVSVRLENVCVAALPIELLSLRANAGAKSVMVKWETAAEIDNDYMVVERSNDGADFVEIGRLAARGQELYGANYELEDEAPNAGVNYYRLRQVDLDGTATYSQVVSADYLGAITNQETALRVYPSVIERGQTLTIQQQTATATTLMLSGTNGRALQRINLTNGQASINLADLNLKAGIYFLTDMNGSVARFIVR